MMTLNTLIGQYFTGEPMTKVAFIDSVKAKMSKNPVDYSKISKLPYKNEFLTANMFQALGTSKLAKFGILSPDGKEMCLNFSADELAAIKKCSADERRILPLDYDTQSPISIERMISLANAMGKSNSTNPEHKADAQRARQVWESLIKMHDDAAKTIDSMGLHGSKLYYSLMLKSEFLSDMLEFAINKAQAISSNTSAANIDKASISDQKKNLLAAYGNIQGKDYAQKIAGFAGTVFSMGTAFFSSVKTELITHISRFSDIPDTLYMLSAGVFSAVVGFAAYYGIDIMKARKQNSIIRSFDKKINHRTYQEVSINRLHVSLVQLKSLQLLSEYGMFDELSRKASSAYFALAYMGDFETLKRVHNDLELQVNYKIKGYLGENTIFSRVKHFYRTHFRKSDTMVSSMARGAISQATMTDGAVDVPVSASAPEKT